MPTPQQLDSLKALMSGGQNIANSRMAVRQKQLQDPRTSDPFRRLVGLEDAEEAEGFANDPMSQRYEQIAEGQNDALAYDQPGTREMRNEDLYNRERLATAPARTAGMFNVEAARVAGQARGEAVAQAQAAQSARAAQSQSAIAGRQQATMQGNANRQRVGALQSGKANSPRPSDEGFLSRWLTGPSQQQLNDQEIASLQGGGGDMGGDSDEVDINEIAQELSAKYPGASAQQLIQAANNEFDGLTDADIQQLVSLLQ